MTYSQTISTLSVVYNAVQKIKKDPIIKEDEIALDTIEEFSQYIIALHQSIIEEE